MVFKADAENDKYSRQIRSSAGIAVFVSARDDKERWVRAGRACQRFALQATARFGYGQALPFSARRPVEAVLA